MTNPKTAYTEVETAPARWTIPSHSLCFWRVLMECYQAYP